MANVGRSVLVWAGVVLVVLGAASAVRAMGQPWWCACGRVTPWVKDIWSSHCSQHLLDAYALTHVSHGLVFGATLALLAQRWPMTLSVRFLIAMTLEAAWEVLENSPWIIDRYRTATVSLNYTGDSVVNVFGDLLACGLGVALVQKLGWRTAAVIFAISEIALLLAIRDNLSLNVLMLAWPVEGVKQWQALGQGG
jgi:hypothetical protein